MTYNAPIKDMLFAMTELANLEAVSAALSLARMSSNSGTRGPGGKRRRQ